MAQKRMFDKSIMETDNFLNISLSAKAIYFLLGMEADDEGFVSPTRILRLYGGEKGDLKNLIDVGLIIPFKSGVIVITDWNQNNWLDNRRIKPTQYQIEKKMLILTEQKKYELSHGLASAKLEERRGEENSTEENRIDSEQSSIVAVPLKESPLIISEYPQWLNQSAWDCWLEYKKEKKQKLTKSTIEMQLKFLESNKGAHIEIIKQSITNGWTGLFALKGLKNDKLKSSEISDKYSKYETQK